jgi:DNA-binding transcriptional MerR regulator/GGDEF domain-containing protein
MSEQHLHAIKDHLQKDDVQKRIQQNIRNGRSEATVSIGRAARLFKFSENQLRDWEERGLLTPLRPGGPTGQRQYSFTELDKLAIIRELIDAKFAPGEIPTNIDKIWESIPHVDGQQELSFKPIEASEHFHLDQRIEQTNKELFWRYYAPQVLRLSLKLICADMPDSIAALILPLHRKSSSVPVPRPDELPTVGESLIGWLDQRSSISMLFDPAPSFEVPSDFRLLPLQPMMEDVPENVLPKDSTLIVVQRKAVPLTLNRQVVEIIQRLLASLYEVENWQAYFGRGMRDVTYPAIDFDNPLVLSDHLLTGFTNLVVHLGGKMSNGQNLWRFCCILLPKDHLNPFQQRSLVVRAQSKASPHTIGVTAVSPKINLNSLTLRAFQSGSIVYRPFISPIDPMIAHREVEVGINSAIAVPIGAENGQTVAVLYIASSEGKAFSENDQRLFRIVGRMIEELILIYRARIDVAKKLVDVVKEPGSVDTLFREFLSENNFLNDIEKLLCDVKTRIQQRDGSSTFPAMPNKTEQAVEEVVSFLAIDANRLSNIGFTYGDQVTRNLSRAIGMRIQGQLRALFTPYPNCRLYHIYTGRYCLMLKGVSLELARNQAERLRQALKEPYHIDALRTTIDESTRPMNAVAFPDVTVRIGITSYLYTKLEDFLQQPQYSTVNDVILRIVNQLDEALKVGKDEGGDVVISWDPSSHMFKRWSPKRGE